MIRFEHTVLSEGTSVIVTDLIGVSKVLSIARKTQETPEIKYLGSPTNGQIKVNLATGELEVNSDTPFFAGEKLSGIYE